MSNQETTVEQKEFELTAPVTPEFEQIFNHEAAQFVSELEKRFGERRRQLLASRAERQQRFDAGELPDFLPETQAIREGDWAIGTVPNDLQDRRVEITGPVDRKMVINALNSGASVFMADFEDAHSPTWEATMAGQVNLRDALRNELTYTSPEGKQYRLGENLATLLVRFRGWHLEEKHVLLDARRISAALFDFGVFLFTNHRYALDHGKGLYFYLPKLENHLEARLWNDVFRFAEQRLGIPPGTIKCTVLIETITAVFEMDEILYELRDYIVALNAGRWDYIFSFIKCFHSRPDYVLPNRAEVTMTTHFLRSYARLLITTCHRRGAHAMGGMAAQIPIKGDPEADQVAREKVRLDKEREASDGHDGTWVAHPGLVQIAMDVFNAKMPAPNQLEKTDASAMAITQADLLRIPDGEVTLSGVRVNVSAAVQYMASWLGGRGAVPIHHLMEDAATAEISRSQLWQWIHHSSGVLNDGREVTAELFEEQLQEELTEILATVGTEAYASGHYEAAAGLLREIVLADEFKTFLTLPAYELLP